MTRPHLRRLDKEELIDKLLEDAQTNAERKNGTILGKGY